MKNPLNKRLPRELKSEFGKYLVLFIFLAGMIALVSGFLVAMEVCLRHMNRALKSIISKMVILNWMKKRQLVRCRKSNRMA